MGDGLRITGGRQRGRKLFSPPPKSIRPASDLLRQAVFNMIGKDIEGTRFYDVFAGTGVVGIEALSRGASKAIFIERERRQNQLIHRNLEHVDLEKDAEVRLADAHLWARHFLPGPEPTIVFLGPPYELFEPNEIDRIMNLVETVQTKLRNEDILVFQFAREVPTEKLPARHQWYRLRRYGKTQIGLWSLATTPSEDEANTETDSDDADFDA